MESPSAPPGAAPGKLVTRAVRFEVVFPTAQPKKARRKAASAATATAVEEPQEPKKNPHYARLWGMQDDLRLAATRTVNALWLLRQQQLPHPEKNGKQVTPETLAYQALSGTWQPWGEPIYQPKRGPAAGSGVRNATASEAFTRFKVDATAVFCGTKSLPVFKNMPIHLRAVNVRLLADGGIDLAVYGAPEGLPHLVVRPWRIDSSTRHTLEQCRTGAYKAGSAKLTYNARRKKWFFSQSFTFETKPLESPVEGASLVAAIDTGLRHALWIAYLDAQGQTVGRYDAVPTSNRVLRSVANVAVERKQRGAMNRADLEQRAGRGRNRKLRAFEKIGDHAARLVDTMLKEHAAIAIRLLRRRGCTAVALEEHADFAEGVHRRADNAQTRAEGALIRKNFFRLHAAGIRDAIVSAAEREGITVLVVPAQWTSRTCHRCGLTWKRYGIHADSDAAKAAGRFELERFLCSATVECEIYDAAGEIIGKRKGCGYQGHADHNAAINIGRLGLRKLAGEPAPSLGPVRVAKKRAPRAPRGVAAELVPG